MKIAAVLLLLSSSCAVKRIDEHNDLEERPSKRIKLACTVEVANLGDLPQPLFLVPGTSKQWPITIFGDIELNAGDNLELFCPTTFANPPKKSGSQTATCVSGVVFKIDNVEYDMTQVKCTDWPSSSARKTDKACNGGIIIESGIQVGIRFVKQLEICFNENEVATRYVFHTLSPESKTFQSNVDRIQFQKAGFFGRLTMESFYSQNNQKRTLARIFGEEAAMKYLKPRGLSTLYLARGHFAAKADFIYATEQRGTFLFLNAAPQWQSFNAGNWQRVEDNTRKWVAKKQIYVNCWTGAHGITTLPNDDGVEKPLYLHYDENKNGIIPVPKLYFRVIIEPSTKLGVVFLGVNNPYLTMEQIKRDYIICKDVSDKLDFLTWEKNDIKAGYSYACEVNDFAKNKPKLPTFDVVGLLV